MASTQTSNTSLQTLLAELEQGIKDANATRYISAVGLVVLLYEFILTFSDEVRYVWTQKPSMAKKLFLFNRYLSPICQILIAIYLVTNHWTGADFSNIVCGVVITVAFVCGVSSMAVGNTLVILRVISLWDRDVRVARFLGVIFITSISLTITFMVMIIKDSFPYFEYTSYGHTCYVNYKSKVLPAVWASIMFLEVTMLCAVLFNAISKPRSCDTPLRRVLHYDGVIFFGTNTILRSANMAISIVARDTLTLSPVFFVWAITTVSLNRSLLRIFHAAAPRSRAYHSRSSTLADETDIEVEDGHQLRYVPSKSSKQGSISSLYVLGNTGHGRGSPLPTPLATPLRSEYGASFFDDDLFVKPSLDRRVR